MEVYAYETSNKIIRFVSSENNKLAHLKPSSANSTKSSNTLKHTQHLQTNYLNVAILWDWGLKGYVLNLCWKIIFNGLLWWYKDFLVYTYGWVSTNSRLTICMLLLPKHLRVSSHLKDQSAQNKGLYQIWSHQGAELKTVDLGVLCLS